MYLFIANPPWLVMEILYHEAYDITRVT
jgi:hypothetical protein